MASILTVGRDRISVCNGRWNGIQNVSIVIQAADDGADNRVYNFTGMTCSQLVVDLFANLLALGADDDIAFAMHHIAQMHREGNQPPPPEIPESEKIQEQTLRCLYCMKTETINRSDPLDGWSVVKTDDAGERADVCNGCFDNAKKKGIDL